MTKMTGTWSPLAALGVKAAVILTVLSLNAAQAEDLDFIGCRKDSRSRLLGVRRKDDDAMTPALCKERCQGFKYYGVEFRHECFCGNTLDRPDFHGELPESKCDMGCAGDASFKCGGRWRISLYRGSVAQCQWEDHHGKVGDSMNVLYEEDGSSPATIDACKAKCQAKSDCVAVDYINTSFGRTCYWYSDPVPISSLDSDNEFVFSSCSQVKPTS